jgi:flavin reductase (DIM6/NTAB) family NADH-FMN oxidoreductase RutF
VLGVFPTGVMVLTAVFEGGERVGMTIGSFTSLSLKPQLVMFSVARTAKSLPGLLKARQYGINVLRHDQQAMSAQFANAHHDKWKNVALRIGQTGCLLLSDALAAFECIPHATYEGGDHLIFVVEVTHFESHEAADPLVFYRGRYAQLAT